jgi:hypothetical protein
MRNLINRIQNFFKSKKEKSIENIKSPNDLFFIHIVYDKTNKLANLYIDYNGILQQYEEKKPPLSSNTTLGLLTDAEHLANCLYSLCKVRDFLPSLIFEDLNDHKKDSELHDFFISSTLSYVDQVIANNKKRTTKSHKPLIRPSQVFKNGQ